MMQVNYGETVQHVRWLRNERNAHGKTSPVFADPVDIENVGLDRPNVAEPRDGTAQRQDIDLLMFLPAGMSADYRDHFIVRGVKYEVEGDAPPLVNMFSGTPFLTEVRLRRVTG